MIRSMPLEDDLGQSRKETLDLSTALFLAQSLHGGSAALKLCCAHASLGSARVAWSRAKGLLEASRSIRKRSSSSSLKLRSPLAIIVSACGNSSQTGAYASVTPALVSLFLRGFALPPFALALVACAIGQAGYRAPSPFDAEQPSGCKPHYSLQYPQTGPCRISDRNR